MKLPIAILALTFGLAAQEKCSVEGTVLNAASGEVLKKAHVMLRPMGGVATPGTPLAATTDAAGHFALANVNAGRYSLSVAHTGFIDQFYGAKAPNRPPPPLVLDAGAHLTDIVIRLTPQGVIAGRVVDEDGDPLPMVNVTSMKFVYMRGHRQLVNAGGNSMSNDKGEYRIFGLPPGKYYVVSQNPQRPMTAATTAAEENYVPTYYPNALGPESATPLEITAGAELRGIDMTLAKARTVRIRGHVTDANNNPVDRGSIYLSRRDGTASGPMSRNFGALHLGKGLFELQNVTPGSYVLVGNYGDESTRLVGRLPIDVGSTGLDNVQLVVAPAPEIHGRVVIEGKSDAPLSSLNVYLEPKGPPINGGAGGETDKEGVFHLLHVGPDAYNVNVFGLSGNLYLKSIKLADADVTDTGIDLTSGVPPGELKVVISAAGGEVEGTVQDDKQQTSSGAQVVLVPESSKRGFTRLYRAAVSDSNGHFDLKGVPPGEYQLFAWEQVEMNAWQDPDFLKPFESRGESVTVKETARETKQIKVIPAEETKTEH